MTGDKREAALDDAKRFLANHEDARVFTNIPELARKREGIECVRDLDELQDRASHYDGPAHLILDESRTTADTTDAEQEVTIEDWSLDARSECSDELDAAIVGEVEVAGPRGRVQAVVHATVDDERVQERWTIHVAGRYEPVREFELDGPKFHSPTEAVGYVNTRLLHHAEDWYRAAEDEF